MNSVLILCRHAPFLIPFQERAWVFQRVVSMDRQEHRSIPAMFGGQREVVIHRDRLFEVCKSAPTQMAVRMSNVISVNTVCAIGRQVQQ